MKDPVMHALYRELEALAYLQEGIVEFVDFGLISHRLGFDCLTTMQETLADGWRDCIAATRAIVSGELAEMGQRF
ncbi:MAG: hypothetical protein EOO77_43650 [Oxalobacteraceae bacterium]|nr:MAG: hypothetical protein EOO77_43650 [Oxalobacteraceae bacterium]